MCVLQTEGLRRFETVSQYVHFIVKIY